MEVKFILARYDSGGVICHSVILNDKQKEVFRSSEITVSTEDWEKIIKDDQLLINNKTPTL